MEIDNREMTDSELEIHTTAILDCLHALLSAADKLNVDRDQYMEAVTNELVFMAKMCTFEEFDLNSERRRNTNE